LRKHQQEKERLGLVNKSEQTEGLTSDISSQTPVEKLGEAVSRGAKALPAALAEELKALFSTATLASLVAVLGVYLAAHATGIGQAVDIGMLIAGSIFFGLDAFTIFSDLAGFAGAMGATTEEELDIAGECLASAVAKIGVDALMTLLTSKVADEISKNVDNVNQVDEITASSDEVNPGRINDANDLDNANKTPSTDTEATPITANNINYHEGIRYKENLPKHLRDFDGIGKNGINGTHNLDVFEQVVTEKNIKVVSKNEHPNVKGIYDIKYQVPKVNKRLKPTGEYKKPREKTVYDPSIHSDDKILQLGKQASTNGYENAVFNNRRIYEETVQGIRFRIYLDLTTKEVTNFHPVVNRND
jgi:hypothetical protein